MARKRKTFSVDEMIDSVNKRNRESTCRAPVRQGWNAILEEVLHSTGRYNGYGYLLPDKVPDNYAPGIWPDSQFTENRFVDTDDTRRFYYKG